ncbi:MAG: DUF1963 domain-containing protein [Chloroflexi bacterium]|nr:DUF1963 domain-containing protein [Chloroflexota bacterium]
MLKPQGSGSNGSFGSRVGGLPWLPPSLPWPQRDGRSMAFIAQVDLGSQPRTAAAQGFPREGLLLFFYDIERSQWGYDPKHAGGFAVIHVPNPGTAKVVERPRDLADEAYFGACGLASELTVTIPPPESVVVEDLNLSNEQRDAYFDLHDSVSGDDWAKRALLAGYPDQIQGDMTLECEMVRSGLYCGNASAYSDPRMPHFRKRAQEWRLLLQVPSFEPAGMMWGDDGCLYYWIREDDLKAHRFERSWTILQCG